MSTLRESSPKSLIPLSSITEDYGTLQRRLENYKATYKSLKIELLQARKTQTIEQENFRKSQLRDNINVKYVNLIEKYAEAKQHFKRLETENQNFQNIYSSKSKEAFENLEEKKIINQAYYKSSLGQLEEEAERLFTMLQENEDKENEVQQAIFEMHLEEIENEHNSRMKEYCNRLLKVNKSIKSLELHKTNLKMEQMLDEDVQKKLLLCSKKIQAVEETINKAQEQRTMKKKTLEHIETQIKQMLSNHKTNTNISTNWTDISKDSCEKNKVISDKLVNIKPANSNKNIESKNEYQNEVLNTNPDKSVTNYNLKSGMKKSLPPLKPISLSKTNNDCKKRKLYNPSNDHVFD